MGNNRFEDWMDSLDVEFTLYVDPWFDKLPSTVAFVLGWLMLAGLWIYWAAWARWRS